MMQKYAQICILCKKINHLIKSPFKCRLALQHLKKKKKKKGKSSVNKQALKHKLTERQRQCKADT